MSPGELTERKNYGRRADGGTSDRDLSEFLLRACHDLKSSLRAIHAHAELIRRDGHAPGASDLQQRLGFIVEAAGSIDSLADGLSGYSIALQIEEGSFRLTQMDAILRIALAKLDEELRRQDAEVTCGELPRVSGDPDRLVQIFETLIGNALGHRAQPSPRIHITAEKRDGGWLFAVRDNGPGVDAAYLELIFKPFERLHTRGHRGAGMGLTICREIVERHGGRLWAESKPGAGSTFLFTLPDISQ